jgi:hypothetical protein
MTLLERITTRKDRVGGKKGPGCSIRVQEIGDLTGEGQVLFVG